jgi:hypothetical protein
MHRRTIFVAAAVLAIAGAQRASAQAPLVPHPTVGILAGVNLAKLSGGDIADASNRTGFVGGLFVTLHFAGGFAIEPEALYTMQGSKFKDTDFTVKLDYISVPVLLRYDFKTPGVHPYIFAGPTFSFKAKCQVTQDGDSADCSDDTEITPKSFDIGATGGAGVAFGKLSVSARYTAGFSKVADDFDAKNRTISVLAGLAF